MDDLIGRGQEGLVLLQARRIERWSDWSMRRVALQDLDKGGGE